MPVLIRDLVADPTLSITAQTSHCATSEREVTWVATTELPDPAPFFRGGELVCTTALQDRTEDEWRRHIENLLAVPIAGLCIGTGLIHDRIPEPVVQIAEEMGLALLNSPVNVPFIQISRWVADRIFADQYRMTQTTIAAQDELLASLLAGSSLSWMVGLLARRMGSGTQIAIMDVDGRLLAQAPDGAIWPDLGSVDELAGQGPETAVPITVGGETIGYLRCRSTSPLVSIASYAANILGLEIARRHAVRSGRRMLASQILEDLIEQSVSDSEAGRRLRPMGFRAEEPHVVVVGRAQRSAAALLQRPSSILSLFQPQDHDHVTATLGGEIVIVASSQSSADVGRRLLERLRSQDPRAGVGVGSAHVGVAGVRASYFEARQALTQGPGLHEGEDLLFSAVLIGSADRGVRELSAAIMQPLLDHDKEHGSSLVLTLSTYLECDGSSSATCRALHLHRNSLRYRLAQINELTNRDLTRTSDRFELWFALKACQSPELQRFAGDEGDVD